MRVPSGDQPCHQDGLRRHPAWYSTAGGQDMDRALAVLGCVGNRQQRPVRRQSVIVVEPGLQSRCRSGRDCGASSGTRQSRPSPFTTRAPPPAPVRCLNQHLASWTAVPGCSCRRPDGRSSDAMPFRLGPIAEPGKPRLAALPGDVEGDRPADKGVGEAGMLAPPAFVPWPEASNRADLLPVTTLPPDCCRA